VSRSSFFRGILAGRPGRYCLDADEWAQLRNEKIGFVFQTFNLLPRTSALENVIMPLSYTAAHLSDQEGRQRPKACCNASAWGGVGPRTLSTLRRAATAGGHCPGPDQHPSILFADDPTGNLDSKTSEEVLELFRKLNEEEGMTIILVTHDATWPAPPNGSSGLPTGWWKPKNPKF